MWLIAVNDHNENPNKMVLAINMRLKPIVRNNCCENALTIMMPNAVGTSNNPESSAE